MDINIIKFGNPTEELKTRSETPSYIIDWFSKNGLLEKFIQEAPPNSSKITREDFRVIQNEMAATTEENILFAEAAEADMYEMIVTFIRNHGFNISKSQLLKIVEQTDPLLFFLKEKINRPRPAQLAYYYNLNLYPLIHSDANSAAYPSGHAFDCYNLCRYLCTLFPNISNETMKFTQKISRSRVYTGLHYPSDEMCSKALSDIIWDNNLIKIK